VTLPRDHEAEGMTTVNQDQVVTQTPEKEISAEDEEASLSRPQLPKAIAEICPMQNLDLPETEE
jgi:hypothetical protein